MIGLYGGSFDPIHNGHLRAALVVQQQLNLAAIKFIPCGEHAFQKPLQASNEQRLAMLTLALAEQNDFSLETIEIDREETSYTVQTLERLSAQYPGERFALILGLDAFLSLPQWNRWQELLDYASLIVTSRPGYVWPEDNELARYVAQHRITDSDQFLQSQQSAIFMLEMPALNISSCYIRLQLQQQHSIDYLLPSPVVDYIAEHSVYD